MGTPVQNFLSDIDAFLERSGMAPSALGKAALNDPNFVADVRNGRMPNLGLVQRVQDFIASQAESAS
jgi:hypothetical protein